MVFALVSRGLPRRLEPASLQLPRVHDERHQMKLVVGLGANLGQRRQTLEGAIAALSADVGTFLGASELRETKPLVLSGENPSDVPAYLNGAVLLESKFQPKAIIEMLHTIERRFGRRREDESKRWQSRLIDLDLLALEEIIVNENRIVIPHPELHKRDFMLEPFVDLWPDWFHPILKKKAVELLRELRSSNAQSTPSSSISS